MREQSYLITILKELLEGKTLTSSDKRWVNTNQYFRTIKENGIELIEVWKPNLNNKGRHKERRLNQSLENIRRAESYLKKLQG